MALGQCRQSRPVPDRRLQILLWPWILVDTPFQSPLVSLTSVSGRLFNLHVILHQLLKAFTQQATGGDSCTKLHQKPSKLLEFSPIHGRDFFNTEYHCGGTDHSQSLGNAQHLPVLARHSRARHPNHLLAICGQSFDGSPRCQRHNSPGSFPGAS